MGDKPSEPLVETIQDLLIVQLALAGVDGHSIRRIARVNMSRVTHIVKVLNKRKRGKGKPDGRG
jgi:hypothetical protein